MAAATIDKYVGNTAGFIKKKTKFKKKLSGCSFTVPDDARLIDVDGELWWRCSLLVPFVKRK